MVGLLGETTMKEKRPHRVEHAWRTNTEPKKQATTTIKDTRDDDDDEGEETNEER
jgi:hypothetical protein